VLTHRAGAVRLVCNSVPGGRGHGLVAPPDPYSRALESLDKGHVPWGGQPLAQDVQDLGAVELEEGFDVQPEAWKDP